MLLFLLSLAILSVIYFKLVVPFLYWQRRKIFYVPPWSRFRKVFLSKEPFTELIKDAYNQYPDRRYYGSYQFMQPSLFVRDLDLIKKITVKDFEHFTDHMGLTSEKTDPILGLNLFSLKGQKWKEMRSMLSPAFTSSKMKAMYLLIAETAENFTEHFLKMSDEVIVVEMKNIFQKYTNDVIANCAFGVKCDSLLDEKNEFYSMGKYVSTSSPLRVLRSLLFGFFPKVFEFFKIPVLPTFISQFFLRLIRDTINVREKVNITRPDMIHLLMEARKGRLKHEKTSESGDDTGFATVEESDIVKNNNHAIDITDEVITAQALVFFIAGFTTASAVMSFLSYELAINPEIQEKLQEEIDITLKECEGKISYEHLLKMRYLDQVVSEALRKWPPGYVLSRVCVKDYLIENPNEPPTLIEEGCLIAVPVIAIHYSPEYFPNPDKFDPDRFSDENKSKIVPGSYMPFGIGPRNCIGSRFALLEIKALMVSFMARFEIVPVEKTVIPLKLSKTLALEAKGGVWLGLKRRK